MSSSCTVYTIDKIYDAYVHLQKATPNQGIYLSHNVKKYLRDTEGEGCAGNNIVLDTIEARLREKNDYKVDMITPTTDDKKTSEENFYWTIKNIMGKIAERLSEKYKEYDKDSNDYAELKAVYEVWSGIEAAENVVAEFENGENGTFNGEQMKKKLFKELKEDIDEVSNKIPPDKKKMLIKTAKEHRESIEGNVKEYEKNMYGLATVVIPYNENERSIEQKTVMSIIRVIFIKISDAIDDINRGINNLTNDDEYLKRLDEYLKRLDDTDLKNADPQKFKETYNTAYTDTNKKIGLIQKIKSILERLKENASYDGLKNNTDKVINECEETIEKLEKYKEKIEENARKNGVELNSTGSKGAGKRKQRRNKTNKLRTHNNTKKTKNTKKKNKRANHSKKAKQSKKAKKARKSINARKTRKH